MIKRYNDSIFFLFTLFLFSYGLKGQCPASNLCTGADVICDIKDIDGFSCKTSENIIIDFPDPTLCFGLGIPRNITWWAFVGNGSTLTLTFNVVKDSCEKGTGIQAGVFEGYCDNSKVWACNAFCNTSNFTLHGKTEVGTTYYVWVNGCQRDVCPYTLSIDTSGGSMKTELPDSIPPLTTSDPICPCNTFEVCVPDIGDLKPTLQWFIDGREEKSHEECLKVEVHPHAPPMSIIEVCLVLTIGNPNDTKTICDQDTICDTFIVKSIQTELGHCKLVCYESQPVFWHGNPITSSCISPPCSARVQRSDGCCVDSLKPFILLPHPGLGVKDTFICDVGIPYIDENGKLYIDEVCDELIVFKRPVTHSACPSIRKMCDTSYYLSVARFKYSIDWEYDCAPCSGNVIICPNVEYNPNCPNLLGQVNISLDWYDDSTGKRLGNTTGDGCIIVDHPGRICFTAKGHYKNIVCTDSVPHCIVIPEAWFSIPEFIAIDSIICKDSIGIYEVKIPNGICDYIWTVQSGNGLIITRNSLDSSRIRIKWNDLQPDTGQICVGLVTDCSRSHLCTDIFICPKTSSTDQETEDITLFYSIQSQSIYWSDLDDFNNIKLTILDLYGRQVLTTKIRDSKGRIGISQLKTGVYMAFLSNTKNEQREVLKCVLP